MPFLHVSCMKNLRLSECDYARKILDITKAEVERWLRCKSTLKSGRIHIQVQIDMPLYATLQETPQTYRVELCSKS